MDVLSIKRERTGSLVLRVKTNVTVTGSGHLPLNRVRVIK